MDIKLSSLAIRHPIPVIVVFFMLTIFAILAFNRLPINADPSTSFPLVNINITQNGASPDEMENAITRRVENAVSGLANVRHITSTITEGSSVTFVEFQFNTDTDRAVKDVRNAITEIRDDLPQSINNPQVERIDIEGSALIYYAVESPNLNKTELAWFIDDVLSRQLLSVDGVQQVKRLGGEKREIKVMLKPERLTALMVSAEQISSQLAQTNINMPAGRLVSHGQELSIRVIGSSQDLTALAELPITLSNNRKIKLSDLATIVDSHAEMRSITRLNGREVLGFSVFRTKGSSDTVVAKGIAKQIENMSVQYPAIRIVEVQNFVDTTQDNYTVAISTLLEGAALTILVVLLFLRSWRVTFVAAIALPLSILPTFGVMYLLGYTLNSISLLAITLVIGILVDDAIVEIENIERHLQLGKRPYQAAIDAADEIGFAVVAITATIVAVFLPVSFIGGMTGQYFRQFGITASAAIISSLLVARLVTPLLAAYILQPTYSKIDKKVKQSRLKQSYLNLLAIALSYRKFTLFLGCVFLTLSIALIPLLPTGFMPKGDTGISQVEITLPPSSSLQKTNEYLKKIDLIIRQFPEVDLVFISQGGEVNKGDMLIKLKPYNDRSISQKEFEDKLRKNLVQLPDIRFAFRNEMAQRDVSILLTGNNPNALSLAAKKLKEQMQNITGIENIQINAPLLKPELLVKLLPDEAARRGITPQAVGNLLRIATVGDTDSNSARFNFTDRQIPIRVTLSESDRNDLTTLYNLYVISSYGDTVPLKTIATLSFQEGSASIERFDRERRIAVEADLMEGYTIGPILDKVNELPILKSLPDGVRMPTYGDAESMDEMFEQFSLAIIFGLMIVLMVLVLLFRDFLQPFTILIALPLSIGGAIAGLLIYGGALDMSSVIGLLMLMGIVTKNSILLVDFVIEKRAQRMERTQALIQAGSERVRPIMMTTIAMVAGMMPAVFAGGAGAAFRAPMAVTVICGLITSTLLSLIFVPVFYSFIDDLKNYLAPKLANLTSVTDEDKKYKSF